MASTIGEYRVVKWYVLRKTGQAFLTLFIASIVVFVGVRALPGDTAVAMSSEGASPAVLAQFLPQRRRRVIWRRAEKTDARSFRTLLLRECARRHSMSAQ